MNNNKIHFPLSKDVFRKGKVFFYSLLTLLIFTLIFFYLKKAIEIHDDQRKTTETLLLSWQVQMYSLIHHSLPSNLSEAAIFVGGHDLTSSAKKEYKYVVSDHNHFSICTNFQFPSKGYSLSDKSPHYGDPEVHGVGFWNHDDGYQCATRKAYW